MMKKSKATKIAKLWNERQEKVTAATRSEAIVHDCGDLDFDIEIYPTAENTGTAFYNTEELVDFSRVFCVNNLVCVREGKTIGKLF